MSTVAKLHTTAPTAANQGQRGKSNEHQVWVAPELEHPHVPDATEESGLCFQVITGQFPITQHHVRVEPYISIHT
jgi:hypothetical protein